MNSQTDTTLDPQSLAEATGRSMYDRDQASQALGMELLEIQPGRARLRMTVREDMLNGHRTCHGGLIFALADSAFAFACNSRNQATVAAGASIEFLAPGRPADVLIADAAERALGGKTGVYDVTVTNQDGRVVALFRGKSHRIRGTVIPGTDPETGA